MINLSKKLDTKLKPATSIKKKSGFTLIELIVVIAIIAILAAALTPSFTGYISEAKKVKVITQAKNVVTAYESDNARSASGISKDTSVNAYATTSTLLDPSDVDKLSNTTIEACYNIVDTDKFTFEVSNNGSLNTDSLAVLPSTDSTTE